MLWARRCAEQALLVECHAVTQVHEWVGEALWLQAHGFAETPNCKARTAPVGAARVDDLAA